MSDVHVPSVLPAYVLKPEDADGLNFDPETLTLEQAQEIVEYWDHESRAHILAAAYGIEDYIEDNVGIEDDLDGKFPEWEAQSEIARPIIENYELGCDFIENYVAEDTSVQDAVEKACALVGMKTPELSRKEFGIVLLRLQTTISNTWDEVLDEDPESKADQLLSEVRDVLMEAAEEFCSA